MTPPRAEINLASAKPGVRVTSPVLGDEQRLGAEARRAAPAPRRGRPGTPRSTARPPSGRCLRAPSRWRNRRARRRAGDRRCGCAHNPATRNTDNRRKWRGSRRPAPARRCARAGADRARGRAKGGRRDAVPGRRARRCRRSRGRRRDRQSAAATRSAARPRASEFSVTAIPGLRKPTLRRSKTSARWSTRAWAAASSAASSQRPRLAAASIASHSGWIVTSKAPAVASCMSAAVSSICNKAGLGRSSRPSRLRRNTSLSGRVRLDRRSTAWISAKAAANAASASLASSLTTVTETVVPKATPRRRNGRPEARRVGAEDRGEAGGGEFERVAARAHSAAFRERRAALGGEHQRHALTGVVVDDDAFHALETFAIDHGAALRDRVVAAFGLAELAGIAAFDAAREPVPAPQQTDQREGGAERAQIAAEELEDEQAADHQPRRIEHERQAAHEDERDRGLERLDLGDRLGRRARRGGGDQHRGQSDIFEVFQPRVPALRDAQRLDTKARPRSATSSCMAPNGQSQPQNVPLPQTASVTSVNAHSTRLGGS